MLRKFESKINEMISERRHVTVLFADISGFTDLSEKLDPEEVKNMLNNCFDYLVPIIEQYGGFIDKFIGDEVMALFGAPFSTGNEPERALRASLELMNVMEVFNARYHCNLGIHIGINTGLVIAGGIGARTMMQYTVIGDAVNLASRLESLAPKGEIYVGYDTYVSCKEKFLFEEKIDLKIKGKQAGTKAYRLLSIKQHFAQETIYNHKFVGRAKEIKKLKEIIETWGASFNLTTVALIGKPGIGKTRLINELKPKLNLDQTRFIFSKADQFSNKQSFSFIAKLLYHLLSWDQTLSEQIKSEQLEILLNKSGFSKVPYAKPLLFWLLNISIFEAHQNFVDSLKPEVFQGLLKNILEKCIQTLLGNKPIILGVDNYNFIDEISLSIIERLGTMESIKCLIIALVNDESGLGANHQKVLYELGLVEKIELLPLNKEESLQLIQTLIGDQVLQANLLVEIIDKSEGNPNFLMEFFAFYKEIGNDRSAFTAWFKATPVTLKSLTLSRIDKLSNRAKKVIGAASVISNELSLGLLRKLLNHLLSEQEILIGWQELIAGNFIHRLEGSNFDFSSKLVADTAYSLLLKDVKREFHIKAATTIEELDLTSRNQYAVNIANHFELAGQNELALKYLLIAIRQTYSVFANYQCLDLLARSIKILEGQLPLLKGSKLKICKSDLLFVYEKAGELYGLTLQPQMSEQSYLNGINLLGSKDKITKAKFYCGIAKAYSAVRKGIMALEFCNMALSHLEKAVEPNIEQWNQIWVTCALEKGKAIYFSGEAKQLNEFLKEIRSAIMKRGSLEQVMQLDDLLNLNDLYIYAYNKLPKSTIRRAYLNAEKSEVLNDPKVASWANNFLGFILLWQNKLEESEFYMKKSLTQAERISSYENVITAITYLILFYRKKQNVKKASHYIAIGMKLCLQTRSNYLLHFKAAELSLKMNHKPRVDLTACLQEVLQLRKTAPPNYPLKFIFEGPLLRYYLEIADFSNAYICLNSLLEGGQKKWDMPIEKCLKILAKNLLEKNELAISTSFKDLLKANKIQKLGLW